MTRQSKSASEYKLVILSMQYIQRNVASDDELCLNLALHKGNRLAHTVAKRKHVMGILEWFEGTTI